jgi:hypothetical protein
MRRMTVLSGLGDMELDQVDPAPLRVREPLLSRLAAASGRGIIRAGGGYAAVTGLFLAVFLAAGLTPYLTLFVAGMCFMHACSRASEAVGWHMRGGRLAARRRRKYQGAATPFDVRAKLSPSAAARKMRGLAPALPAGKAFLPVGITVHVPRQLVAVSRAEAVLVVGGPQTLKTALLSNWALEAPGALLATSSRADQYRHTAVNREVLGEVAVLDADGYGPGTSFAWSPVDGCGSPRVAMRRAGALMHSSPRDASGKDQFHEDRGVRLIYLALHAVSLAGGNMMDVRSRIANPDDSLFMKDLRREGAAAGWAEQLEQLIGASEEQVQGTIASAEAALGWMNDPVLAAVACPEAGEGLDLAAFLRKGAPSVYLIGSERPYGGLTPYFSLFASEFLEECRVLAERSGGRLPVPATVVADEAATTARLDFARWCTVSAGYNITIVAGLQAMSQLSAWGDESVRETILELFTTKVLASGTTSRHELELLSLVCGEVDTWHRDGRAKVRGKEPLYPPERLRQMADLNALLLHRNSKPVQVKVTPVWQHPQYAPAVIKDAVPETTEE